MNKTRKRTIGEGLIKKKEKKEDGRIIIYYSRPESGEAD